MNQKLYMACAGMFSLAMLACSESVDSPLSGTAEEPNVLMANNDLPSSSSIDELSSSSVDTPNSSADVPNSSAEEPTISSSSEIPMSSSSSDPSWIYSSAYIPPVLCKVNGAGGCVISYEGDLWTPFDDLDSVRTARYAEDGALFGERAGKWFWDTDSIDGGKSTIQWMVEDGVEWDSLSLKPVIEYCDGLCGTIKFDKGDLTYDPFVEVGFNVAGFDSNGVALSADVSNWTGICVSYSSTIGGALKLDLGDSLNRVLEQDVPYVTLPKSSIGYPKCFEWSKFKRAGWGTSVEGWEKDVVGEKAAQHLVKVVFWFQNKTETQASFQIYAVGSNLDEY